MGLSILIPVYNYDVTDLVNTLSAQLSLTGITGEVVLLDDGSDPSFDKINSPLSQIPYVKYFKNLVNAGRTASRKLLAESAQYNYLLFLDCDSLIIKEDFLKVYCRQIDLNEQLVSGGRIYNQQPPDQCSYYLHWKYGSKREAVSAFQKSGPAFMSHNFLVKKSVFQQLDFTIQLKGYGHEDSFWGIQFRKMGIEQKKIINPVLHASLEEANVYLRKSEQAIENLLALASLVNARLLKKEIKIFRWFCWLKTWGIVGTVEFLLRPFQSFFRKNLLSCSPSLFFFDCYRLALLIRFSKMKLETPK